MEILDVSLSTDAADLATGKIVEKAVDMIQIYYDKVFDMVSSGVLKAVKLGGTETVVRTSVHTMEWSGSAQNQILELETGRCALGVPITYLQWLAGIWLQDQANMSQRDMC
ncbi:hypothetical protein WISP_81234 [Willisornis vidua]|uniref:Uncharacterized protein n=1 Tax=Willisornis vidua TaxID=1566151 RepID=A0ABQ9DAF2_9PASS|nr:hypothetical protein WISP_81234 [Willisornis vidua]